MKRGILITLLAFALFGCKHDIEEFPLHEQVESKAGVDLPEIPDFSPIIDAPRNLADGALTVWGLIFDKDKHWNKTVQVTGYIRSLSEDCPFMTNPAERKNRPRPGQRQLRRCKVVYLTIADAEDATKELLVVDYHPYFHPHFKEGMKLELRGKYTQQGAGFVRPRDGMLVVESIDNYAVSYEGHFTQDPVEVLEMKAAGLQAGMRPSDLIP